MSPLHSTIFFTLPLREGRKIRALREFSGRGMVHDRPLPEICLLPFANFDPPRGGGLERKKAGTHRIPALVIRSARRLGGLKVRRLGAARVGDDIERDL